jgi:mannosyltransferase OCH1-like enzyme
MKRKPLLLVFSIAGLALLLLAISFYGLTGRIQHESTAQAFFTEVNSYEEWSSSSEATQDMKKQSKPTRSLTKYSPILRAMKAWKDSRASKESTTVPKIMHQSWRTKELPLKFRKWSDTCKLMHPEWTHILWTDEDNRQMVADFFPYFLPIYDNFPAGIFRADVVRYMYMYLFGGVYIDLDTDCLRPYDEIFNRKDNVYIGSMNVFEDVKNHKYPNAFLASSPGHPLWTHTISKVVSKQYLAGKGHISRKNEAEHITGPAVLYESITSFLAEWPIKDIYLLPSSNL